MESRRPIHYHRNTVDPRKVDRQEIKDRLHDAHDKSIQPAVNEFKHYARNKCIYCGYQADYHFIVCPTCNNCQYCGLVGGTQTLCHLCGNELPLELHDMIKIKTIRLG